MPMDFKVIKCKIANCNRQAVAMGMCIIHRDTHIIPEQPINKEKEVMPKTCPVCGGTQWIKSLSGPICVGCAETCDPDEQPSAADITGGCPELQRVFDSLLPAEPIVGETAIHWIPASELAVPPHCTHIYPDGSVCTDIHVSASGLCLYHNSVAMAEAKAARFAQKKVVPLKCKYVEASGAACNALRSQKSEFCEYHEEIDRLIKDVEIKTEAMNQAALDELHRQEAENAAAQPIPGPCTYCGTGDHWRPDCTQLKKDLDEAKLLETYYKNMYGVYDPPVRGFKSSGRTCQHLFPDRHQCPRMVTSGHAIYCPDHLWHFGEIELQQYRELSPEKQDAEFFFNAVRFAGPDRIKQILGKESVLDQVLLQEIETSIATVVSLTTSLETVRCQLVNFRFKILSLMQSQDSNQKGLLPESPKPH